MTKFEFNLYADSKSHNDFSTDVVHTETLTTDFYNLKNKAAGARRYGYANRIVKGTNARGEVAFRFELQTTLNGEHYQSSKYGEWCATQAEAQDALLKAVTGALKRYTKLSKTSGSGVEYRTELAAATTCKLLDK